ncbi:MAG: ABC transporter substrate-binding protein [Chloroflexi bacterium]|nr:ABC transporter substrate-binding protein [Chloroflexota bacterium]
MSRNTRNFRWLTLLLSVMVILSLVLSACGPTPTPAPTKPPEATVPPTQPPSKYKEAPTLAELVKAGKLPPVDQRLPEEPLVVKPIESIGKYGGTWRRGFTGIKDFHAYGRQVYDPILRWPRDPKDPIQPGLAKKWEWSADGKILTLYLRKGIKWSDGKPFTTRDITFWWEDIELNKDITPAGPHAEWVVAGKPMELEVVDDYTIKLKFAKANGIALSTGLAFHGNQWPLGFERFGFFAPRHYLEQFHPKYNKELKDYKLFEDKAFDFNTERPVLTAWQIKEWGPGATKLVAKRNPYYWKVDPAGNQLPYIDEIALDLFESDAALNLKAIEGGIDFQFRRMALANYPIFKQNEKKYGYHILTWPDAIPSKLGFFFNQSIADQSLRQIFQNKKFRQAMSVAIDRKKINEASYLGLGKPRNFTVVHDSAYYQPELEDLNAQYDPALANKLLDEIGLKKGPDGWRTKPDGTRLEITVEGMVWEKSMADEMELVVAAWNAVGVKVTLKTMTREIYWPRACANEVQVATWTTDRGLVPMVDPIYIFPFDERSWMAPLFGIWYKSGGKLGEKPPEEFKKAMDLYDKYKVTVDPKEQVKIGKELVKMAGENLWVNGTVGMVPNVVVVKDNLKNVPKDFTTDWIIMSPGTLDPPQFYFEK